MTYLSANVFYEKTKHEVENSPSAQEITTSWADVSYSTISYLPAAFSKYVIYDFSVSGSRSSTSRENAYFKLQYSDDNGSSWSDWGDNTQFFLGSKETIPRLGGVYDIKFCLKVDDSGSRPKWTKERILKLQVKKANGTITLHKFNEFRLNGANVSGNHFYSPTVCCYSIASKDVVI